MNTTFPHLPKMSASELLNERWNRLVATTRDILLNKHIDKDLSSKYELMLHSIRHDRQIGDKTLLGLRRAPASKAYHHAFEGGLVFHILQMWDLWHTTLRPVVLSYVSAHDEQRGQFRPGLLHTTQITDTNVFRAILHHDLNKIYKYVVASESPWVVDYANELDEETGLLGDTHKSLWILNFYGITLPLELHNALINAEGGYASDPTRDVCVLAKITYLLDELSANVIDRIEHNQFWTAKRRTS